MSRSSLFVARPESRVRARWSPLRRLTVAAVSALTLVLPMVSVVAGSAEADTAPVVAGVVPTVSADALPTVQINGVAWDQVVVGNTVYVTGEFTSARPAGSAAGTNEVPRTNLLAYNLTTGALITGWAPTLNAKGAVITASADGTRIFVGGSFTSVSGVARYRVAALDATTGAVLSWNVVPNSRVRSLVVSGTTLYMGGIFTTVGSQARTRLAAVSTTTGALLPWAPAADAEVMTLTAPPGAGKIVAGGKFTTLNGADAYGMGALDATNGATLPWAIGATVRNGGEDAAIYSLSSDSAQVYGTGYTFGDGGNFEGTFAASATDGAQVYVTGCRGDTYDATPIGGVLYSVGHSHDCSSIGGLPQTNPWTYQHATAQTTTPSPNGRVNNGGNFSGQTAPELLHWLPDLMTGTFTGAGQAAWTVEGNSNYVVLGGEFPRVNNTPQQGLVRFAVRSIAPNTQGPQAVSEMTPNVRLLGGRLRVSWKPSWDRDNRQLTYDVLRGVNLASSVSIATMTQDSTWYSRPQMFFNDQTAPPGTTQSYRIRVRDALGNTSTSNPTSFAVPTTGTTNVYSDRVLADGAIHLWRLGESDPTTAYDYVAADDLILDASATRGADGAMVNDGTARSTTFAGTAVVPAVTPTAVPSSNSLSTEAWFRTTSTSGGKIVGFGNSNTGGSGGYDRHIYMTNAGKIVFGVYTGATQTLTSAASYNDGQWHQVVSNLGSTGTELFIDGKRIARNPGVTSGQDFTGYWRIGGDNLGGWPDQPSSSSFAGGIEDVSIYGAPLTLAQVQAHYEASGRSLNLPSRPTDAYGAAVWDAGATLYWRLDDAAASTTALDRMTNNPTSGNYSAGIVKQQPGSPAAASGSSIRLPAGSDQNVIATDATSNPTTYSLETWFRTSTTHGGRLFGFGSAASGYSDHYDRQIYMLNDGRLRYGIYDGSTATIDSTQPYNDGQWHQVVATQSSVSGERLFVDGVQVATGTAVSPENYTGYWRLGADNAWGGYDTTQFDGSFDEAAVYDTALPATTVAQHYQLGAPPAVNQPPTAAFSSTKVNLKASFDASASADPDGTIASYNWQFGDGSTGTGKTPDHTYAGAGSYDVVLTVKDDDDASATVTHSVSVTQPANVAPTAAFTVASTKLKATFDGSGSTDPDGTIASYAWDFGDGSTGTGVTPAHTYTATGSYTAVLTVTDNQGASATATKTVAVTANAAPTAAFGSTCTNLACSFTAAASTDTDGTIASYSWNFGDGTSAGTGVSPSHTYATGGTKSVTLTVTDDDGATNVLTQQVTVAAANNPPTARLTSSGTGLTRGFDGSTSTDADGSVAGYAWTFGDGTTGTGVTPSHTYTAAGSYTVALTVTDNQGATGTASTVITVTAPNQAPVARFTSTCTELDCSFTAATSSDPDGSVVGYAWNFGDGTTGTGVTPTHHYAAGTYTVTLTVTDDVGATNAVTHPVSPALTPNQAPTAAFTSACTNLVCGFDGSTSTDTDGSVTGYAWTFGDGTTGTGVTPTHTYSAAGTFAVALTVTDNGGATKTLSKNVTVTAAPVNQAPTAAFTSTCTNLVCSLDASGSTDPDGTVTGYAWSFSDGGTATGKVVSHTFAAAGSYTVVLTVTDNQGATNSLTRGVAVTTGPVTLATDAFTRTVASGFGSADTGGAWTFAAAGATGSVTGGAARLSVPVARTATMTLAGVSNLNTDVTDTVWADAMPTGGGTYLGTMVRSTAAGDYSARVKILPTGVVSLALTRSETVIGTAINVAGLTYTAGTKLQVRVQAVGSSPTTLRARVWVAGTTEPTNWMVSTTDTTAGYQVAGAVGLTSYVSSSATAPLVLHYDDFKAATIN
jgi:PKD repeat protein